MRSRSDRMRDGTRRVLPAAAAIVWAVTGVLGSPPASARTQGDPEGVAAAATTAVRSLESDALGVQSAFVTLNAGVYQLFVRLQYPLDQATLTALRDGTSVSFTVDVEVLRPRRFWLDADILAIRLTRELSFQSVTERYVVRDPLADGDPLSFATAEEALVYLGQIDAWPILVTSQLAQPGEYLVRVRTSLQRGRLTAALRTLMFWSDDFQRESEWYEWSLQR